MLFHGALRRLNNWAAIETAEVCEITRYGCDCACRVGTRFCLTKMLRRCVLSVRDLFSVLTSELFVTISAVFKPLRAPPRVMFIDHRMFGEHCLVNNLCGLEEVSDD